MTLAVRQVVTAKTDPGTTVTLTFGASVPGSLLLAFVGRGTTQVGVTWTPPAGWTQVITKRSNTGVEAEMVCFAYVNNPGGVTAAAFAESSANQALYAFGYEVTGADAVAGIDLPKGAGATAGTAMSASLSNVCTPTITFAAFQASNNGGGGNPVFTGTAGYTVQQGTGTRSASGGAMVEYKIQSSSGSFGAFVGVTPSSQMAGIIISVIGPPTIVRDAAIIFNSTTGPPAATLSGGISSTVAGNAIFLTIETGAASGAVSNMSVRNSAVTGFGLGIPLIEIAPPGVAFTTTYTGSVQAFYLPNIPAGLNTLDLIQFSTANNQIVVNYFELQGFSQINLVDGSGTFASSGAAGTAVSVTSSANKHTPIFVLGLFTPSGTLYEATPSSTPGATFTSSSPNQYFVLNLSPGGNNASIYEYKETATIGTQTADATLLNADQYVAWVVNFAVGSSGNLVNIAVASAQNATLKRSFSLIKKVNGTGLAQMIRARFRTIKVIGSGIARKIPTRLKTIVFSNGGTARVKTARIRIIAVAGTGAALVNALRLQLIKVVGSGVAKFVLQFNKTIFVKGVGVMGQLLAPRFRPGYLDPALATTEFPDGQPPRDIHNQLILPQPFFEVAVLRKLAVVGTHFVRAVLTRRIRLIFVAGTGVASTAHIRSVIMAITGSGVVSMARSFFRTILVVGLGVTNMIVARLLTLLVAGTGTVKMVRTRLRRLFVTGTGIVRLTLPRFVQVIVAGTGVVQVLAYRVLIQLITVLGFGDVFLIRKITKTMKMASTGIANVLHARHLKMTIAVVGSGLLGFIKRKGTPTLAHKTRFNITAQDGTQRNIKAD